jgi:aminoglycoside phosphotransferase (APT) family kinase protein
VARPAQPAQPDNAPCRPELVSGPAISGRNLPCGNARRHPNQRAADSLPAELRRTTVPADVRLWIERQVHAVVVKVRRLEGASSTAVHGVYLDNRARLVLRRYVWPGFLEHEPIAPRRELDALEFASSKGLSAPQVVAADLFGTEIGDGVPAILMTFLPGRAIGVPDLFRLAEVAATIHETDPGDFGHDYFPWYDGVVSEPPEATRRPRLWQAAIELRAAAMPAYRPRFIHRDFHPGNVLWSRGRASGVVDWANACKGPPGCDVAHCRANLVALSGQGAADGFLSAYEQITGETYDWYWELASILENSPSHFTAAQLAESEPLLAQAVEAVSGSRPEG